MDCKHAQELIYTDYTDGRLPLSRMEQVRQHLESCQACRLLAQQVEKDLALPLSQSAPHLPHPFIWQRIKSQISQPQAQPVRSFARPHWGMAWLPLWKPAVAAALILVAVTAAVVYRNVASVSQPYLASVLDVEGSDDVTSGIERYFL